MNGREYDYPVLVSVRDVFRLAREGAVVDGGMEVAQSGAGVSENGANHE